MPVLLVAPDDVILAQLARTSFFVYIWNDLPFSLRTLDSTYL
jgi:hypothetical protein